MRTLLSLCLLIFPLGVAMSDTVYKWVDERGVTHYSQTPPPNQPNTRRLEVESRPAPGAGDGRPAAAQKWREDAAAFQRRWDERKKVEEEETRIRTEASANRQAQCDEARAELARLMATKPAIKGRPTISLAHPDTREEVQLMNNAERTEGISRAERDIEQWCD